MLLFATFCHKFWLVIQLKKLLSDKAFTIELICFIFLQVAIDIYRVFFESSIQIFGISLPELLNIGGLFFLTLIFFLKFLKKPKFYIPIATYTLLVAGYLVFHTINILKFNQNIFEGSELNWFKEIYFIIRTYLIPVYVFYYLICSSLTFPLFKKTVSALSLFISSNIVITNIFKVSFIAYASTLEKNSFITRNIFQWFYNPDKEFPAYMTSKGWFYMGNQIGLILFMLFVFVILIAFEKGTLGSYLLILLNGIALAMIGTKVSSIGGCLILILGLIFAVVFGVILKQFSFKLKNFVVYSVITAILFTVVHYSPMYSMQEDRSSAYELTEEQKKATESLASKFKEQGNKGQFSEEFIRDFSDYVNSSPYFFGIHPEFLQLYTIEDHFEFWYDIVIYNNNKQVDYRYMKSLIYDDALACNDNIVGDKLFGIGYISAFPYSEYDFISQNIWFGYLGTLLFIGPYLMLTLYGIFIAIKNIKKCFIYQNAFFALGICAPLLISYLAGHLFFGIFSITIFAFITVAFYKFQLERQKGQ